jgi:hypothetical protein
MAFLLLCDASCFQETKNTLLAKAANRRLACGGACGISITSCHSRCCGIGRIRVLEVRRGGSIKNRYVKYRSRLQLCVLQGLKTRKSLGGTCRKSSKHDNWCRCWRRSRVGKYGGLDVIGESCKAQKPEHLWSCTRSRCPVWPRRVLLAPAHQLLAP